MEPLGGKDIFVKFSIKSTEMLFDKNAVESWRDVVVKGSVTRRILESLGPDENDEDFENEDESSAVISRGDGSVPGTALENREGTDLEYYINCAIGLSEMVGKEVNLENVEDMLLTMRASVSLNGEDYCEAPPDNIIMHTFTPSKVFPQCLPMESSSSTVRVLGSSLLPSNLIETEAVVSVAGATSLEGAKITLPPSYLDYAVPCPISCRAANELNFSLPNLKNMLVSAVESSRPPTPGSAAGSIAVASPSVGSIAGGSVAGSVAGGGSAVSKPSSRDSSQGTRKAKAPPTAEETVNSFLLSVATVDISVTFRLTASSTTASLGDSGIVGIETDSAPLTNVSLPLILYKETPIRVSPGIFRRVISGVCTVPPAEPDAESAIEWNEDDTLVIPDSTNPAFTISSNSLLFYTETAKIVFKDRARELEETIPATMERPVEPTDGKSEIMELKCKCPNLYYEFLNEELGDPVPPAAELRKGPQEFVEVMLLLDGESVPAETCHSKIPVFDGLSDIELSREHHGHHGAGSSIKLHAEGIVDTSCIIRISGPDFGKYIEVTGMTHADDKEISFTVPEAIHDAHRVEPHIKGKDKMFFVSISLDGGLYFDRSTEAILHIK